MKNEFILLFLLVISIIQSQLTQKERENLLKKYTKKIDRNNQNHLTPLKDYYVDPSEITYDSSKIREIIKKYNFPENYNFIEETNAPIHIKDQKNCGACWAFASTTALAYRYHKKGIEVDLSPQSLISCYFKDCEAGDFLVNTHFSLVKNGTITEGCLPYSSANGKTIEQCPIKCKNGEEFKKYYAKNVYSTELDYDKDNYYDIVTIIMDQLINYGPVVSGINCYEDFQKLDGSENCFDKIYKYDKKSNYTGGHAVVIVGYGYEQSKYYWLIQNSWGADFCQKGFAKVEFSEIGIENVGFSEPYIPENEDNSNNKEISAKFTLNGNCRLDYNTGSDNNDKSFELRFQNVKDSDLQFYYQCNSAPLKNKNEGICNYDFYAFFDSKGYYKYSDYNPINNNNKFNLDFSSLPGNQFYYYGTDLIGRIYDSNYYISEEGSGVLLVYSPSTNEKQISKIYPNEKFTTALSDCKFIDIEIVKDYYLIYCKIKQNEINYFEYDNNLPLAYDILCGHKERMDAIVHKLDKSKYPVFRVKQIILPQEQYIGDNSKFIILANVEGGTSGVKADDNLFFSLINIKRNNQNYIDYLLCEIKYPVTIINNFKINCYLAGESTNNNYLPYQDIYLTNYYYPVNVTSPFEVIIETNITGIKYKDYFEDPYKIIGANFQNSKFIKATFLLIFSLLLLL